MEVKVWFWVWRWSLNHRRGAESLTLRGTSMSAEGSREAAGESQQLGTSGSRGRRPLTKGRRVMGRGGQHRVVWSSKPWCGVTDGVSRA